MTLLIITVKMLLSCLSVFISFHRRSFSWLKKKNNNCNASVQVSDGMLYKYCCIKGFCLRVTDIHRKNLQGGHCAKECQLNREKLGEVKGKSYKLSNKLKVKSANHRYLLTNLGSRPDSALRHYCKIDTTLRGIAFATEGLPNLVQLAEKIRLTWWL